MSMVPQSQYEQLMGDFTTINLQLNETRNKLYDSQQQAAALQATLKTTQAEFTKSSKQLRRARREGGATRSPRRARTAGRTAGCRRARVSRC